MKCKLVLLSTVFDQLEVVRERSRSCAHVESRHVIQQLVEPFPRPYIRKPEGPYTLALETGRN